MSGMNERAILCPNHMWNKSWRFVQRVPFDGASISPSSAPATSRSKSVRIHSKAARVSAARTTRSVCAADRPPATLLPAVKACRVDQAVGLRPSMVAETT